MSVQSFIYDAHDKLTSGTAGAETDGYDANGNETVVTISGATYHDTYDDEDRLTSVALPGGPTDAYAYNGLGLRVGKQDSTGTYSYLCDGTAPGSPVLSDGHAVYTPGLSENRGGSVSYPSFDRLGNLWTQDSGGERGRGDPAPTSFVCRGWGTQPSIPNNAPQASRAPLLGRFFVSDLTGLRGPTIICLDNFVRPLGVPG